MSCSDDGKEVRERAKLALHKTSNRVSRHKQEAESKQLIDESPALQAIEVWLSIGRISPGYDLPSGRAMCERL